MKLIRYRIVVIQYDRVNHKSILEPSFDIDRTCNIYDEIKKIVDKIYDKLINLPIDTRLNLFNIDKEDLHKVIEKRRCIGYIFYKQGYVLYRVHAYKVKWLDEYYTGYYNACKYRSYTISRYEDKIYISNKDGVVIHQCNVKDMNTCFDFIDDICIKKGEE